MYEDCCWYVYEKDTNTEWCNCPEIEDEWASEERDSCDGCPKAYSKEDAKADAKYGGRDYY